MSIFSKKNKVERGPQYFRSATNMQTLNYNEYYMSKLEKMLYSLIAFAAGAAVGYVFYGGFFKDADGYATLATYICNVVICSGVGLFAIKMFIPMRTVSLRDKRKIELNHQFRDMLEALTSYLGAGSNIRDAFIGVREDLKIQYDEGAYIIKELDVIIVGIYNNVNIEDLLFDFGERSGNDDIKSFADVFKTCYRKGGNIRDVIANTRTIINDKIEIRDEIETTVSANKLEQNILVVMPIVIVGIIKSSSPEFGAKFATVSGAISTTIAVVIFVMSYKIGKKILDIKL